MSKREEIITVSLVTPIFIFLFVVGFILPLLQENSVLRMLILDSKSIIILNILLSLTIGFMIVMKSRLGYYKENQGTIEWAISLYLYAFAFSLFLLRPYAANWFLRFLTIVVANGLLILALGTVTMGLRKLFGMKKNYWILGIGLSVNMIIVFWQGMIKDNINIRIFIFSLIAGILILESAWVLINAKKFREKYITKSIFYITILVGIFYIFRAVGVFAFQPGSTVLGNNAFFSATYLMSSLWVIIWSFMFMFLYNRKLESELIRSNDNMQIANNTKDKLFYVIAHDLKNPIGTLAQYFEYLSAQDEVSNEEIKKLITVGRNASQSSFLLLNNLLEWAKVQQDLLIYEEQSVNLREMINELLPLFQVAINKKQITFTNSGTKDVIVRADRNMIGAVIRNLLSNAIKFTPVNGQISFGLSQANGLAELVITDSGVGMSQEQIQALNQSVINKSSTGTQGELGSGLGLVIVKDFIEHNKGQLKITSTPGKGTSIRVFLPLEK